MRCLERSPTDRMLAFAVTARSWFAGARTAEAALMEPIAGRLVPRRVEVVRISMESCDANARVSTEQTRIVAVVAAVALDTRSAPLSIARAWTAFSNARFAGVWR